MPSIDIAIKNKRFEQEISAFTRDVVFFARNDKRFTHPYSDRGMSLFYQAVYDWVDSLTKKSFQHLIKSSLKASESQSWGSMWVSSRHSEVENYVNNYCNAKALAMIFMNGSDSSTLRNILFQKIVEAMKKEFTRGGFSYMKNELKYQLVVNFDLEKDSGFYLANLKHHSETIQASRRQLLTTTDCYQI